MRPVKPRTWLINREAYLMREDLLVNYKQEFVIDVLIKYFCKFLLPLWIICLSNFALMIFNQVNKIITYMHRGVDERALLMQGIVISIN
jgi:hypothetical protein